MAAARPEEKKNGWVECFGEEDSDYDDIIPTPEELKDFYTQVLNDLKTNEHFPTAFAATLADPSIETYQFSSGTQLNPDWILQRAPDQSNIIHFLIEAVNNLGLPVDRAGLFTRIVVQHDYKLICHQADMPRQQDPSTPKGGKNPLEFASLYPNCIEIVKAICEDGMVKRMTKKEKEMMMNAEMTMDSSVALPESEPPTVGLMEAGHRFRDHLSTFFSASAKMPVTKQGVADDTSKVEGTGEGVPSWTEQEAQDDSPTENHPPDRFVETADGNYIYRNLFWTDLIKDNEDSCVHMAIRDGNNNSCAEYLLERIRLTKETESVLGRSDHNGLTPLLLAVDFKNCKDEQVDFVKLLIGHYPDALKVNAGEMSYDRNTAGSEQRHQGRPKAARPGQVRQSQESRSRRVKSSAAPYKYFLESQELALHSNRPHPELKATKPPIRRSKGSGEQQGSFSAAGNRNSTQVGTQAKKKSKKVENPAAAQMADLLKLSCMRCFGRNRPKLTELLDSQNQIHLDLNPRTQVTARLLDYIANKKLEQYLQYVYIPNLRVLDVENEKLEREGWWDSPGRKDYAYIFDWLRNTVGVIKIIRVVVEDDPADFHSDEVIEHSLRGFDVEEWKWFKWDLCIDTILEAAPNVREVNLYWSGNKAILKSWTAPDGLVSLRQLEKICIMQRQSKESRARTNTIVENFKDDVKTAWKERWKEERRPLPPPEILMKLFTSREHLAQSLSEKELEEKGKKDRWLKCMESFGKMLRKWLNQELSEKDKDNKNIELAEDKTIKVAVIDDGVNIDSDDIAGNVEEGETFYDNLGHWPGYYQSSYGHGHLMACLIRDLCPRVKLYIAKLNELWTDGRNRVTPESAAEAINWAQSKDVDIISMSWTIENVEDEARTRLETAVSDAAAAGILLFCACDDQGNMSDHPYPAKNNQNKVFKIGSATTLGIRHKGTNKTFFDYIAPGSGEVRHVPDNPRLTAPEKPLFGSSIATARCAGLAAMILQCMVLVCPPDVWHKSEIRKHDNMKKMFDRMVEKQDTNNYIKVWNVFETAMNQSAVGNDPEGNVIKTVAGEFMRVHEWKQLEMTSPQVTIKPQVSAISGPLLIRPSPFASPRQGN